MRRDAVDLPPKSIARSNLGGVAVDTPAEVVDDYTVRINLTGPFGSMWLSNNWREEDLWLAK
jgi:hypothetical protein